jgi:ABC-type transport system involved in Fe-S cluster assembly fused permease/ATPase subunit
LYCARVVEAREE